MDNIKDPFDGYIIVRNSGTLVVKDEFCCTLFSTLTPALALKVTCTRLNVRLQDVEFTTVYLERSDRPGELVGMALRGLVMRVLEDRLLGYAVHTSADGCKKIQIDRLETLSMVWSIRSNVPGW